MLTTDILRKATETTRLTVTVVEAAKLLGIGKNAAYEAANAGQLPVIRIGRRMVVPVAALERLLDPAPSGASPRAAGSTGAAP